jgi:hypothetical protein
MTVSVVCKAALRSVVAKPNFCVEVACENEHEHLIYAGVLLAARALGLCATMRLALTHQRNSTEL